MKIQLSCPNCEAVASVEEQSLGRRGRCKKCGHVFALARPGGEAASVMSNDASAWKGSAPASPTNLPEQFGRYRIMRTLGQGGMGAVYLAHDIKLNRQVALKVPFFNPADGPQAIQRFEREARAVATLDHPNICPIYDVGEVDGIHFLTMPYIEGKTLSEAMGPDRTVTEAQAAAVVRKLALALQEAHDKGIIHRDLKPGNIMVNRRREMIIMDFGLARVIDGDDQPMTREGHVLGTALYMAPEQATGDVAAIGPASDVYSLGVILYELLTGHRPFEGPWLMVIGVKTVMDPEGPSKHRPDLSPDLNAICLKAVAKSPENRYATMTELAEVLWELLSRRPSPISVLTPSGLVNPVSPPESFADQTFAGIVSHEHSASAWGLAPVSSNRRITSALTVASLIGIFLILWLSGTFKVNTPEGTLVLENVPKNADVLVDGHKISFTWPGNDKRVEIRTVPGRHDLRVERDGFITFGASVIIKANGSEEIKLHLEPLVANLPKEAKMPDAKVSLDRLDPKGSFERTDGVEAQTAAPAVSAPSRSFDEPRKTLGSWKFEDNELVPEPKNGWFNILFGASDWTDYDLKFACKFLRVDGDGLIIEVHKTLRIDGKKWLPKQEFCFGQKKNEFFTYQCFPDGDWDRSKKISHARAVTLDRWYDVSVEVRGSKIRCVLDGEEIMKAEDERFVRGQLGLLTIDSTIRFRDIRVLSPTGDTLWDFAPHIRQPADKVGNDQASISEIKPEGNAAEKGRSGLALTTAKQRSKTSIKKARDIKIDQFFPLFNGTDFQGWFLNKGNLNAWSIEDGILSNIERPSGILTEQTFSDFALKFEFQAEEEASLCVDLWAAPNSTPLWVFLDTGWNAMGAITLQKKDSTDYTVHRFNPRAELRAIGIWNSMQIEIRNNVVGVTLNGRDLPNFNLEQIAKNPEFDLGRQSGHIGLRRNQGKGRVFLRNIVVKNIKSDGNKVSVPPR